MKPLQLDNEDVIPRRRQGRGVPLGAVLVGGLAALIVGMAGIAWAAGVFKGKKGRETAVEAKGSIDKLTPASRSTTKDIVIAGKEHWIFKNGAEVSVRFVLPIPDSQDIQMPIDITTNDAGKKINFVEWCDSSRQPGFGLTDDKGNIYKPIIATGLHAEMRRTMPDYGTGGVYKGEGRFEWFFFEKPVATASYLILELDGKNVGSEGKAKFRIPRVMWTSP